MGRLLAVIAAGGVFCLGCQGSVEEEANVAGQAQQSAEEPARPEQTQAQHTQAQQARPQQAQPTPAGSAYSLPSGEPPPQPAQERGRPANQERATGASLTRQDPGGEPVEGAFEPATPEQKASAGDPPAGRTMHTWRDGDRARTVWQASAAEAAAGPTGQSGGPTGQSGQELLFYDESGQRLTLPGGVVMVFDPVWSAARIDVFFAQQGVDLGRVEARGFAVNAYFVQTAPGLPSLELANRLAGVGGVLISSPNWGFEAVTR